MSSYLHGIYGSQEPTSTPIENTATSGIQAVVGTAPVNLLDNPAAAVNTPILLNNIREVNGKLGYSSNVDQFTLMQAVHSSFEVFKVAPIVVINVLDPKKHTADETVSGELANAGISIAKEGILLSTIKMTSEDGVTTYTLGTDYSAAFSEDGTVLVTPAATGTAISKKVKIEYSRLDPSKVTDEDIIAGIQLIDRVFPLLQVIPEILLAPGYSQQKDVAAALATAAQSVSTVFKATVLADIDSAASKTISTAISAKVSQGMNNRDIIPCFPKVMTTGGKTVWMSAQLGALMEATDSANESTAIVSPSNKDFKISAAVLVDGTPISYTLEEANQLNGEGIFTALNFLGWKSWGNNTGIYSFSDEQKGKNFDERDRFISIKRSFDWQNNTFICRYFSEIDDPLNLKATQALVTDENQFYNAFIAEGKVAGMSINFNESDNPTAQILAGKIIFKQKLAPYTPLEAIENDMQFDPTMIKSAFSGGDNT